MKNSLFYSALLAMAISCSQKNPENGTADSLQTAPADSVANDSTATAREPIMNIEEIKTQDQNLMVMNDSAASSQEIGQKLGAIYGKIGACAAKCKMEVSGAPAAWYNGPSAPWAFTAGMPFKTKCNNPDKGISMKEVKGGKAVVVHFFGPYDMTGKGYEAGQNYIKEKNLVAGDAPYEVYIGDPGTEKDPYKVQTDIVFPIK
jgi:effector-binding domain-containing protein